MHCRCTTNLLHTNSRLDQQELYSRLTEELIDKKCAVDKDNKEHRKIMTGEIIWKQERFSSILQLNYEQHKVNGGVKMVT